MPQVTQEQPNNETPLSLTIVSLPLPAKKATKKLFILNNNNFV